MVKRWRSIQPRIPTVLFHYSRVLFATVNTRYTDGHVAGVARQGFNGGTIMSKFIGGSAYAMARDIGEGYVSVTERTFKSMTGADMNKLLFELDRFLRELRGSQSATDDIDVVKARNRKIQRLNTAVMVARTYSQKHRK